VAEVPKAPTVAQVQPAPGPGFAAAETWLFSQYAGGLPQVAAVVHLPGPPLLMVMGLRLVEHRHCTGTHIHTQQQQAQQAQQQQDRTP
jgi:hypothetical protein